MHGLYINTCMHGCTHFNVLYPFTGQIVVNITTTKEHAINLSILMNVDIGLCGRL